MTDKLKPCPFCGSKAFVDTYHSHCHYVRCEANCIPCRVEVYNEVKDDAIAKWNSRAPSTSVDSLIADLTDWQDPQTLRLKAGEMSAQEVRTVQSVLKCILARNTRAHPTPTSKAGDVTVNEVDHWMQYDKQSLATQCAFLTRKIAEWGIDRTAEADLAKAREVIAELIKSMEQARFYAYAMDQANASLQSARAFMEGK